MTSTITSAQWIAVRRFVEQVRLHAHETVVDKSIIQDIFDVVDAHGMDIVENMIQHEQRLFSAFSILRVEEEFNRGDRGELHKQLDEVNAGCRNGDQTESSGGEYGLSK